MVKLKCIEYFAARDLTNYSELHAFTTLGQGLRCSNHVTHFDSGVPMHRVKYMTSHETQEI